ncbi:nucleotidyltransferase family protein [Candidatus Poriferisodalis sp.]|uniref:nucleotidyltransferase family protein n=1 Tax=Candidatus Poriferisodalis sp. TaxID=3101277 RepID=UPI003B02A6BC
MSTAGVLLAAGAGTRFAGPRHKLLADLDGQSVVSRALGSLVGASLDAVAVVTGAVDISGLVAEASGGIAVISNDRWESGIASSVRCAATWAAQHGHDAIVVGLADQPFVTSAAWQIVAASAAPVAVGTYGGQRGNPVRLAREVWPLLPYDGDEGARTVMRRFPEFVVPVACEGSPDDIDTVEDLRRWS